MTATSHRCPSVGMPTASSWCSRAITVSTWCDAGVERILVLLHRRHPQPQRADRGAAGAQRHRGRRQQADAALVWTRSLELEFKQYTGLDETTLETVDAGSLDKLRAQQLPLEMVQLLFLPEEVERVQAVIDGLGRWGAARPCATPRGWARLRPLLRDAAQGEGGGGHRQQCHGCAEDGRNRRGAPSNCNCLTQGRKVGKDARNSNGGNSRGYSDGDTV